MAASARQGPPLGRRDPTSINIAPSGTIRSGTELIETMHQLVLKMNAAKGWEDVVTVWRGRVYLMHLDGRYRVGDYDVTPDMAQGERTTDDELAQQFSLFLSRFPRYAGVLQYPVLDFDGMVPPDAQVVGLNLLGKTGNFQDLVAVSGTGAMFYYGHIDRRHSGDLKKEIEVDGRGNKVKAHVLSLNRASREVIGLTAWRLGSKDLALYEGVLAFFSNEQRKAWLVRVPFNRVALGEGAQGAAVAIVNPVPGGYRVDLVQRPLTAYVGTGDVARNATVIKECLALLGP